jgi:hypothetical protein
LVTTNAATSSQFTALLIWYVLIAGICYAGRIPVHVFGAGYVSLQPRLHDQPSLCRRLNFLTCLNGLSAIVWLIAGVALLVDPTHPWLLETALAIGFYMLVMWLAMETVACATDLGLPRGTEIVCRSWLGRRFKSLLERAPEESPMSRGMKVLARTTPPHQASSFLALSAAALLALSTGTGAAKTAERVMHEPAPTSPVAVAPTVEVTGPGTSKQDASDEPTYEEECDDGTIPGDPAPSPQGEQLLALWMGGGGIDGAGAIEAGCARGATPVIGHPDVWIARGYCGDSLRSLGIAAPGYLPALLFQGAARFALRKAREGDLRGASARWQVGEGDLYVVDVDVGSFVLVRRNASGGATVPTGVLPCERQREAGVRYQVIPPGLLGIWLELAHGRWLWPTVVGDGRFAFLDDVGNQVATAHCYGDTRCEAWFDGSLHATSGSLYTSVNALASMTG